MASCPFQHGGGQRLDRPDNRRARHPKRQPGDDEQAAEQTAPGDADGTPGILARRARGGGVIGLSVVDHFGHGLFKLLDRRFAGGAHAFERVGIVARQRVLAGFGASLVDGRVIARLDALDAAGFLRQVLERFVGFGCEGTLRVLQLTGRFVTPGGVGRGYQLVEGGLGAQNLLGSALHVDGGDAGTGDHPAVFGADGGHAAGGEGDGADHDGRQQAKQGEHLAQHGDILERHLSNLVRKGRHSQKSKRAVPGRLSLSVFVCLDALRT
jgi:hypothetical protein